MALTDKLKKWGITKADLALKGYTLQRRLAPILRKEAIEYLRNSDDPLAKNFRGDYLYAGKYLIGGKTDDYQEFLQVQARNRTWGTYIELTAIGAALGCHVVVTPVIGGVTQEPICLYRAADANAPTIKLYNKDNVHWYFKSSASTDGDGNCLYNGVGEALQEEVAPELAANAQPEVVTNAQPEARQPNVANLVSQSFFKTPNDQEATIERQRAIEQAIAQHPTPAEVEANYLQEAMRISRLPKEEQQQIADDYKLALALAREDMGYAKKNVYRSENAFPTAEPVARGIQVK